MQNGYYRGMKAFSIRWRSARQHREYELFADPSVAVPLMSALTLGGGQEAWQAGTLWKCPGCGDRTVRTEEFLEGLRRAELYLQRQKELQQREGGTATAEFQPVFAWLAKVSAQMLGCERDRVYIKDEGGVCAFQNQTYFSRI
jgi:hypothetical protein